MLSLNARCGNCVYASCLECVPADVPLPNQSKINKELEKLESLEDEVEAKLEANKALAKAALARMRGVRLKLKRLQKQKRLLKKKEQRLFNKGLETIEELKYLEALERLGQEVESTNLEASIRAATINQTAFQELSPIETSREAVSNL